MKRVEEEFLKGFERSIGKATCFEEIEDKIDFGSYGSDSAQKSRKDGSRRIFYGVFSTAALMLLAAVIVTSVLFSGNNQNTVSQTDPPAGDNAAGSEGGASEEHLFDNATIALLRENNCLFFEDLAFAEDKKNHVFVIREGEIAEHYSFEKETYRDDSFDNVINQSMISAVETIGIPSYTGTGELSLDYSYNDGYIRRVNLVRKDGELTVEAVELLDKEDPTTWLDPEKQSLPTEEECRQISVGMSFDEVVALIGRPQRDVGFGATLFQFDVEGGAILQMRLDLDVEQENKYVHDNPNAQIYGSHCLYVGAVGFTSDPLPDVHD